MIITKIETTTPTPIININMQNTLNQPKNPKILDLKLLVEIISNYQIHNCVSLKLIQPYHHSRNYTKTITLIILCQKQYQQINYRYITR